MNERTIMENMERCLALKGIAEAGSIHKASVKLNISQPSLSVKLKTLEEFLGTRLVLRSSRGVKLTDAGEEVVKFVNEVNELARSVSIKLSKTCNPLAGVVRIGIYESVARYFWPKFFKSFSADHPEIGFRLSTGRSTPLVDGIINRDLDIALTIEPVESINLTVVELFRDHFSLYGSSELLGSEFSAKDEVASISNDLFASRPLISFGNAVAAHGKPLNQELIKCGFDPSNNYEVESFEIALEFCLENIGWVAIPNRVASRDLAAGRVKKLNLDGVQAVDFSEHRICLSVLKEKENSTLIKYVSEQIAVSIKKMDWN